MEVPAFNLGDQYLRCSAETDKTRQLARITVKANTMQVQKKKTKYEMAKSSAS